MQSLPSVGLVRGSGDPPSVGTCSRITVVATQTRTILIDDLDGTEGARTYTFAWGNQRYELDLTDEHRNDMLRALEPYIGAARKVSTRRARANG